MPKTMHCDVVSAERQMFSGTVEFLVVPATEGDIGVLPGHAPLLTQINQGPVRVILEGGEEKIFFVSGGFLEIQPNSVTVLTDTADRAEALDEASIERAKQTAKEVLEGKNTDMDYSRAAAVLAESIAQLRAIQQLRKHIR